MTRYIDADALDSVVLRMNEEGAQITRLDYKIIDCVIFEFPTVDVVPVRHGKWKRIPSSYRALFECSECGEKTTTTVMGKPRYEYCPMCGAKMEEE